MCFGGSHVFFPRCTGVVAPAPLIRTQPMASNKGQPTRFVQVLLFFVVKRLQAHHTHGDAWGPLFGLARLPAWPYMSVSYGASGHKRHADARLNHSTRQELEMPKMKTKSSAKKRFKVTGTGKVMAAQAGKQHGMIKRSNKFLRNARGTSELSAPDSKIVKSYMPYDR